MLELDRRFANHLKQLKIDNRASVAVACSGGPDSMALALLLKQWVDAKKGRVIALTVDHGWHKNAAADAKQVGAWMKKRGIAHELLAWKGRKLPRNQHDLVRKSRYRLLAEYCVKHKITHLFVAHHLEDQAESFLLRLSQGGSVDGLSSMPPVTAMFDVTLVRPLLGVSKPELLDYLKRSKQPYLNDPGNADITNDRVKMRKLLPVLAEAGITVDRLAKTATLMARARAHLEEETGRFLSRACKIAPEGYAVLRHLDVSEEIALRAITTLIMIVGGQEVGTRARDLDKLRAGLQAGGTKSFTFAGCVFARHKELILVHRELRAVAAEKKLKPGMKLVWDNRFEVELKHAPQPLRLAALGQAGWARLLREHKLKNDYPTKNIIYALPALRDAKGMIVAVPHLKFSADKAVQCSVVFRQLQ